MAKDFDSMEDSNTSANPNIHQVSDPAKRISLQWLAGLSLLAHVGVGKAQNATSSGASRARPRWDTTLELCHGRAQIQHDQPARPGS